MSEIKMWEELLRCMKKGYDDAMTKAKEEPDLIPATPELRELAEFLANAKKDSKGALRWYPSWSAFVAATTPAGSCCFQCGYPLSGIATALCDECEEARQKEKKDSTPDFRFSEWD